MDKVKLASKRLMGVCGTGLSEYHAAGVVLNDYAERMGRKRVGVAVHKFDGGKACGYLYLDGIEVVGINGGDFMDAFTNVAWSIVDLDL